MQILGHEGKAFPRGLWLWMKLTHHGFGLCSCIQYLAAACLHGAGVHGDLPPLELRISAILSDPLSSWIVKAQLGGVVQSKRDVIPRKKMLNVILRVWHCGNSSLYWWLSSARCCRIEISAPKSSILVYKFEFVEGEMVIDTNIS